MSGRDSVFIPYKVTGGFIIRLSDTYAFIIA